MTERTHLETLQYWMTSVVMGNAPYSKKLQSVEHQFGLSLPDVVVSSNNIPDARRLYVYEAGFSARLLECLQADYPLLCKFLTDDVFENLGRAYIYFKKPDSYTLFDLGKGFPSFLENTMPEETTEQLRFVVDLARYERMFLEVVRARGAENQQGEDLVSLLTTFVNTAEYTTYPCLRLLALNFPVKDYLDSSEEEPLQLSFNEKPQYLAISRKDYRMIVSELKPWEYYFLKSIDEGIEPEEAIEVCATETGISIEDISVSLEDFIKSARQNGLIF